MSNFEKKLDEYARLIVNFGANVQPSKPVRINAPIEAQDFVRSLVKYAYQRGASEVKVNWSDDFVTQQKYLYAQEDTLTNIQDFVVEELEYYYEEGACQISVYAEDPELLKDVDPLRLKKATEARSKAVKHLMKYTMNDIVSWIVVSVPTASWARSVFPDLSEEEAVDKLWEDIFSFVRVDGQSDSVKAWDDHLNTLGRRAKLLNEKQFKELVYKSEKGTDLRVGLAKNHIWGEARAKNADGIQFIPNMPTEEIYCAPDKDKVNGRLLSTRPLAYNGTLIDGMDFTFEQGRVVKYHADSGLDALKSLLEMDEGASRLGEVALVENDSPISKANTVYNNTLFDENASCHFALGKAYPTNLQGGSNMTDEELMAHGLNDSLVHEDFMVGDESLSIIGIEEDGSEFVIFENGNFAF